MQYRVIKVNGNFKAQVAYPEGYYIEIPSIIDENNVIWFTLKSEDFSPNIAAYGIMYTEDNTGDAVFNTTADAVLAAQMFIGWVGNPTEFEVLAKGRF